MDLTLLLPALVICLALIAFVALRLMMRKGHRRLSLPLLFVLFAVAFVAIAATLLMRARGDADFILETVVTSVEKSIDDQIGYMLHCDAVSLAKNYDWTKPLPTDQMREIAADYDVDELNIIGADGQAISSTDPISGVVFSRTSPTAAPYFDIIDGKRAFIKQKFRPAMENPDIIAKYIAVPIPNMRAFLQLGYYWTRFEREFATFFVPMLAGTSFVQSGYYIIVNTNTGIVTGPVAGHPEAEGQPLQEIGLSADNEPDEAFSASVCGTHSRCLCFDGFGGWRLYVVIPLVNIYFSSIISILITGTVLLLLCATFQMIEKRFRRAQKKIDDMRAQELAIAHAIQTSELRTDNPANEAYAVHALMRTAREVGGDFYDYYTLPDGRVAFAIADVSGKGVPAAIFMMKSMIALKNALTTTPSLVEAVSAANQRLCSNNAAEMFVTAWVGVYDPKTGTLEYIIAGHNPPLLKHADGSVEWVKGRRSLVLAALAEAPYHANTLPLKPGDSFLLYTDGVTEAMDINGNQYGEARLEATFAHAGKHFVEEIDADVARFACHTEQSDDITMLAFTVRMLG